MNSIRENIKRRMILHFYLCALFGFLPFFFLDGYYQIGEDKFNLYVWITAVFWIMLVLSLFTAHEGIKTPAPPAEGKGWLSIFRLSGLDAAVLIYFSVNLLSWLASPYRQLLLMGEQGWHMGLFIRFSAVAAYFLVSRLAGREEEEGLGLILACSAAVFLLGLLNCFGCRPIEMGGASAHFIGTIGNIDWFAGFWSLFFPLGVYRFLQTKSVSRLRLMALFVVISVGLGLICGTLISILVLGVVYGLALIVSVRSNEAFRRFLLLLVCFFAALLSLRFVRGFAFLERTEKEPLVEFFTDPANAMGWVWILLAAAVILLYLYFPKLTKKFSFEAHKKLRLAVPLFLLSLVLLYFAMIVIRGINPGFLSFLGDSPYFILNDSFGSGRGRIWRESVNMYLELSPLQRFVGVGPDGYGSFLYKSYSGWGEFTSHFGGLKLTNGHNILLTELVNIGFLGLSSLILMIGVFIRDQLRLFREEPERAVFLFAIAGYVLFGLFNFDMVLNYPYLFVMMGLGEAWRSG